jgi:hypothetical protein
MVVQRLKNTFLRSHSGQFIPCRQLLFESRSPLYGKNKQIRADRDLDFAFRRATRAIAA